jgi:hypothetical protein
MDGASKREYIYEQVPMVWWSLTENITKYHKIHYKFSLVHLVSNELPMFKSSWTYIWILIFF